MSSVIPKLVIFAAPLLLLALTAVAGYAYTQIRILSLPIPQALGLFTVVLPLITGISTQGVYGLIQRNSKDEQYQLTIPLIVVIGFQLVYETIIATLALTYMLPPEMLSCGLNDRWTKMYSAKNGPSIKQIQDAFDCCGLNSIKDRAWPFQQGGHPSTCSEVFGRNKSCLGPWRKAQQTNAGLFLLVAFVVFLIKVVSIISLLTSSSWTHPRWVRPFSHRHTEDPEDNRATMRRLIEASAEEADEANEAGEQYRDEAGPRVEPSPLVEVGSSNEWRNERSQN